MNIVEQLPLALPVDPPHPPRRKSSDLACQAWLAFFSDTRHAEGAHPRSVEREVSQIRSLAREAEEAGHPCGLAALVADPKVIAHVLLEPKRQISRSTGRARLIAVQRFIRAIVAASGHEEAEVLRRLDALLPARPADKWHAAGTQVAGLMGRRSLGPTLDGSDLMRIVGHPVQAGSPPIALRNRALVAVACFSGLRAEEIAALRWEDLDREGTESGRHGLTARVRRNEAHRRLPVLGPAPDALAALKDRRGTDGPRSGPVFWRQGRPGRALSYRSVRAIVCDACRRAGFGPVEQIELRAAFAWWLKVHGLSDHEAAAALGLVRVRSLDRLLDRHRELQAQRNVRERLER